MKKLFLLFLVILLSSFSSSHAGDINFETTKEGIINALTRPEVEEKTMTRGVSGSGKAKTRGLKIIQKKDGRIVRKTIMVSEKKPHRTVNLKIEFDFDSYDIRPQSFPLLVELGKALTNEKLKGKDIIIKGHTDSTGTEPYNLKLSLNRALAVKLYLTENFPIPSSRLKVIGYGESMPLVLNSSEANRQINRRVEIATD